MSYKVVFSDKATEGLQNVLIYIAETNSPNVAYEYIDKIEQTIERLKEFPNMGKMPTLRCLRLQNFRTIVVESHMIYYKVDNENETIKIYSIKHARQRNIDIKKK